MYHYFLNVLILKKTLIILGTTCRISCVPCIVRGTFLMLVYKITSAFMSLMLLNIYIIHINIDTLLNIKHSYRLCKLMNICFSQFLRYLYNGLFSLVRKRQLYVSRASSISNPRASTFSFTVLYKNLCYFSFFLLLCDVYLNIRFGHCFLLIFLMCKKPIQPYFFQRVLATMALPLEFFIQRPHQRSHAIAISRYLCTQSQEVHVCSIQAPNFIAER